MTKLNNTEDEPILIAYADDHDMFRETIIGYLENLGGCKVIIETDNGKDLVSQIAVAKVKPQVCLVDISMPGLNGFDTVSVIKQRWPDIKILALSGHLSEEYTIKMILAGANGYLTKKAKPREAKRAIFEVYQLGFYNSEFFTPRFTNEIRNNKLKTPHITPKEIQLLQLSIEDKTFDEISEIMNISRKSIEGHRGRLYSKLGIKTRAGLAMYAIQHGYVAIDPGISPL